MKTQSNTFATVKPFIAICHEDENGQQRFWLAFTLEDLCFDLMNSGHTEEDYPVFILTPDGRMLEYSMTASHYCYAKGGLSEEEMIERTALNSIDAIDTLGFEPTEKLIESLLIK